MKINRKLKFFLLSILIFKLGYEAANNDLFPLTHYYDRNFGVEAKLDREPVATSVQLEYSIYAETSQKKMVECPNKDKTLVIAIFGQSNAANSIGHRHDNQNERFINFFNGACYIAKDPLLGAAGISGSLWIPFLKKLDTDKKILVVNFAIGGASIHQWLNDKNLIQLFSENMNALTSSGYSPDLFMWMQGEADALTYEKTFETRLRALVDKVEQSYPDAKMAVSSTTFCNGLSSQVIASVQRKTALFRNLIWLGNTDEFVSLEDRFDGCHFSAKAVDQVAIMFAKAINENFLNKK